MPRKKTDPEAPKAPAKKPSAASKPAAKKPAKKRAKKIDLSVPALMKKARESEQERLARAAELEGKSEEALRPANIKLPPANTVHWGYGFSFDGAIDATERERLTAFFSRFTSTERSRGSFLVEGPQTAPEQRRIDWEFGAVIELEQLVAQLPPSDFNARMVLLDAALADFHRWDQVKMLLSTWDEATLPQAIAHASKALERWPDVLRYPANQWKERPALMALARTIWLSEKDGLDEGALAHATVLQTQDIGALQKQQARLSRIKTLVLSGHSGLDRVAAKLTAMTSIEKLDLSQPTYSQGTSKIDLKALLSAPHLQKLKALSLYGYEVSKEDLAALASCEQPLERLRIQYAKMKPDAAAALATFAAKKRLISLDLKYNDLGPKGAAKLFSSPSSWRWLRVLDFSANEIGDVGAAAIAAANMPELRWLNLSSNAQKQQLTAKAAQSLASAETPNLHSLCLFGHPIGAKGVAALLDSKTLRSLREMNVGYCGVSIPELMTSFSGGALVQLTGLDLNNPNKLGEAADWSRATFMETVKTLNIEHLDAQGTADLLDCPHLQRLEALDLGCAFGEEKAQIEALAAAHLPALRYLKLSGHKLDGASAKRLTKSPLFRSLWGVELMPSYTQPEAWRVFYDAGIPLIGSAHYSSNPASEYHTLTTWREEF